RRAAAAVAVDLGDDSGGSAARPPRALHEVLGELARRNGDAHHGAVDVRILTLPDGSRRAIVDITGTKSWTPAPTADITSLTTNGRALTGTPTAYEQGVLSAMHDAGVRPTDPVMVVGHSEGGMVAVQVAQQAAASGRFDVTHVVTAGSPIGLTVGALPSRVRVLALENEHDVVPHLDGTANPDLPNVTTVEGDHGDGTVGGDHDIRESYVPIARDAEAASSRSIEAFLHSAGAFFRGERVETHAYQIVREY
ncbi:MAG: alpha/beta hydrolase, partial [Williamsia herbipolensis]|nr:alpha/beta hydrolase [Williamsia herbipolensis]